jgi:hypothetical protein
MKFKNVTHEVAREIVELYLRAKGRTVHKDNEFMYPTEFVERHKLKKFPGHSYDILTNKEIIEIDDYSKHSTKNQIINDGIAEDYARKHLTPYNFYRLKKEEIVNSRGHIQPSCHDYLQENLF